RRTIEAKLNAHTQGDGRRDAQFWTGMPCSAPLSSGGAWLPPRPLLPCQKYKLAEYRYGREEMLALYVKENKVPEELQDKEFAAILQEEPLQPLALVPLTEEEQRNFSMSVNSMAVLRLMGKGGGVAPTGVSGGGAVPGAEAGAEARAGFTKEVRRNRRGRLGAGPGRSTAAKAGMTGASGGSRSQPGGMEPGLPSRRGPCPPQGLCPLGQQQLADAAGGAGGGGRGGGGVPGPTPAGAAAGGSWRLSGARRESERWRSASPGRRPPLGRLAGAPRGPAAQVRLRLPGAGGGPGGRRHRGSDSFEDDKDGLPEWCMDDEDEEMATFDSSGAFMPLKRMSTALTPTTAGTRCRYSGATAGPTYGPPQPWAHPDMHVMQQHHLLPIQA
ncbi:unnamed protein product, partial [Lepidochelys kempii]